MYFLLQQHGNFSYLVLSTFTDNISSVAYFGTKLNWLTEEWMYMTNKSTIWLISIFDEMNSSENFTSQLLWNTLCYEWRHTAKQHKTKWRKQSPYFFQHDNMETKFTKPNGGRWKEWNNIWCIKAWKNKNRNPIILNL